VPAKLSLGFAKVTGAPPNFQGINISGAEIPFTGDGPSGRKASGLLMVDGMLYLLARNLDNSQLAWSQDHGQSWMWADWKFTKSFGCPVFLNFGRNYEGARDRYVYVYSHDSASAYEAADRMVLARVPQDRIREREVWEFLQRLEQNGDPLWTKNIDDRGGVFVHSGNCWRSGITFNKGLKRYLWWQALPASRHPQGPRFEGGFGIYDAPEPWGPWTTAYFTTSWDTGPGESGSFPTKWMSADGKTMHLVFSGDDCFSVRRVTLTTANPD
jgi:hypothetical protein